MKVCIGCGVHRFSGYVHVDSNPAVNPDVLMDCVEYFKSLPDGSVYEVIAWHVMEHLDWSGVKSLIDEMYRVSVPGAVWSIRVPHCTSIHAANPQHQSTFSSTFWSLYKKRAFVTGERYGKAVVRVDSCEIRILALGTGLTPRWLAKKMPNFLFNSFGDGWRMLCERLWPFRFDEIDWKVVVVK